LPLSPPRSSANDVEAVLPPTPGGSHRQSSFTSWKRPGPSGGALLEPAVDEETYAAVIFAIVAINSWNRLAIVGHKVPGSLRDPSAAT
jgi:hypothetical protein